MLPVLIVAIVFSVPLAAIVGAYWVRVKRMELESGAPARETEARLRALESENRELRSRVEVLETIVTSDDAPKQRTRVRVAAEPAGPTEVHDAEIVEPGAATKRATRG